jgi:phage repressor protein C with HTH and peptisase S24 domain
MNAAHNSPLAPGMKHRESVRSLPQHFAVVAPDDSMAPVVVKGDQVLLNTELAPRHGDIVLVEDPAGQWWIRNYLTLLDGSWEVQPQDPRFGAWFASEEGASVVGVFEGTLGRRGR